MFGIFFLAHIPLKGLTARIITTMWRTILFVTLGRRGLTFKKVWNQWSKWSGSFLYSVT